MNSMDLEPVVRKLSSLHILDHADRASLSGLPHTKSTKKVRSCLLHQGQPASRIYALLDGFAYRSKTLKNGRGQILSLHLPGDLLNLRQLSGLVSDRDAVTLGNCVVAELSVTALRELSARNTNIAEALWRDLVLEGAISREWMINIAQRTSHLRIAHLLAEFAYRRAAAVPGCPRKFRFPLTQQQLGAATGLSLVHVNRSLKRLLIDGAIVNTNGRIVIVDPSRLQRIAEFDSSYLQCSAPDFEPKPAAASAAPTG